MDPHFHGPLNSSNGFQLENQSMAESSDWKLGNETDSTSFVDVEENYPEHCEFSDGVLTYIDQMLMEEEMEDKTHMLHESLDFQAKERSFYEVLGEKYPPSPQPDNNYSYVNHYNLPTSNSDGSGYLIDVVDPSRLNTPTDYGDYFTDYIVSNSSISSSNSLTCVMDRYSDSPLIPLQIGDMCSESQVGINDVLVQNPKEGENNVENDEVLIKSSHVEARGKENVVYPESNVPTEEFDDIWIYTLGGREKEFSAYITDLQKAAGKSMQQSGQVKGSSGAKGRRGKERNTKKEVIDLTSLLINCAQYVAADDRCTANELLKQIRQHSSPFGDGSQRLAHYFANGLEARLAGTGSRFYKTLAIERMTDSDYMRSYCTSLISSSFRKISNFVSNKLIMIKSEKAAKVHIIDFGIFYGFQWPTFIQRVAEREGGPPQLRITGIDFPQPGSRPAERIEDTGRRLGHYAKMFNVPFEYNAIAQKWETIKIENLKIEKDEFVAVNCLYLAKNLLDETIGADSSRNVVLGLIRKINPNIFIHGIVNGAYSAPFFVTRFREVLFHFSALFDMLETILPRERSERMLTESIFGKEALNVIACEGWERVERPETYKQWQLRHLRMGFMQVPFERKLIDTVMYKVRNFYHRDFVMVEDKKWLLMSWKGRTIYAISCWQSV